MNRSNLAATPAFLALACVGFIASAPAAHAMSLDDDKGAKADPQSQNQRSDDREQIIVTGQAYQPHQESPKATRSVRDTPQTVTVITAETIEQQNLLTLRDMLSTVPGITFGAAEGGTPPSDQINLRGYAAGNDILQDGVRDSAAYSRSDSFNLEQLEVTNGASSVYSGAGSVGGTINIVTKRPLAEDRLVVSAGVGTAEYYRGTVDANVRLNDLIAVRLNAMAHRNDIPGRDVENYKRWGFAPAVTIGVASPTRLTIQYLHQEDTNIPQYGVPYYKNAFNPGGTVPGIDRSDYFGYRNVDTQEIVVDQATIIADHEFSDKVSIRNLARYQQVTQMTIVGPPQGTFCLPGNVTPTGAACPATTPVGYYLIGGPRGNFRDTKNELMYDQIDLRAAFNTGPIEHTLVLGGSTSWEKYTLVSGNALRNANGTAVYTTYPLIHFGNPNVVTPGPAAPGRLYGSNVYVGPVNPTVTGGQRNEVTSYALYLFDAMKLGKFELNGGIRWESNSGSGRSGLPSTAVVPTYNDAKLFSYRAGLVYKPVEAVSLYVAYGNSQTPSQNSVNGACTATGTGSNCNLDPETAKTYEIGGKVELMSGGLLLSAALFRNERDKYRVASNDPTIPDQALDGSSRVDGVALSAVGKITKDWSITANYTYLKAKLLQSVSDFCLRNPGSTGCGNSAANPDPAADSALQNTPEHAGSIFTTYQLPFGLRIGYGATYQGSFAFAVPTLAAPAVTKSDAYWVHNAYLAYDFSRALGLQLNVKNATDSDYFTRIRNNGWATPGDARAAVLTVNYRY